MSIFIFRTVETIIEVFEDDIVVRSKLLKKIDDINENIIKKYLFLLQTSRL